MEKKSVLIIITQSEWGGAQKYVFDLVSGLKAEFDFTVICGQDGLLVSKLETQGIKVKVFPYLIRAINPIKDIICLIQLYFYIKRNKVDLVHTNSSKAEILGNLAAKSAGVKKIVFTAHGFVFNEPLKLWKKKVYIWLERLANHFTSKVIAVSEYDRQSAILNKIILPKKIITVYNGIKPISPPKIDLNTKKSDLNLQPQDFVIGTVANFYPTKGLSYLIEAATQVIKAVPRAKFVLIGDGRLKSDLQAQVQDLNISNNFLFTGFRTDLSELYQIMDLFVLSSLKEGLPYTILEAMSFGLPIIATKVGGIPELISNQKSGLLVEPADSIALAEAIMTLIAGRDKRQSFGQSARLSVEQKFSFQSMIEKTRLIYNN